MDFFLIFDFLIFFIYSSSVVHLWHKTKYVALLTVDILVEGGLSSEKVKQTLLLKKKNMLCSL